MIWMYNGAVQTLENGNSNYFEIIFHDVSSQYFSRGRSNPVRNNLWTTTQENQNRFSWDPVAASLTLLAMTVERGISKSFKRSKRINID